MSWIFFFTLGVYVLFLVICEIDYRLFLRRLRKQQKELERQMQYEEEEF